jgi:mRNA-degrading endonuclease toxin of MazEF toxin-antitoxin module
VPIGKTVVEQVCTSVLLKADETGLENDIFALCNTICKLPIDHFGEYLGEISDHCWDRLIPELGKIIGIDRIS